MDIIIMWLSISSVVEESSTEFLFKPQSSLPRKINNKIRSLKKTEVDIIAFHTDILPVGQKHLSLSPLITSSLVNPLNVKRQLNMKLLSFGQNIMHLHNISILLWVFGLSISESHLLYFHLFFLSTFTWISIILFLFQDRGKERLQFPSAKSFLFYGLDLMYFNIEIPLGFHSPFFSKDDKRNRSFDGNFEWCLQSRKSVTEIKDTLASDEVTTCG